MPGGDKTGPSEKSTGPRDGHNRGKGLGGKGIGAKEGGQKGDCD